MGMLTVLFFTLTKQYKVFMVCGFGMGVLIVICMLLWVPESPRYYVARNREKEAVMVYARLAKWNNKREVRDKMKELVERMHSGAQVISLDTSDDLPFSA